VNQRITIRFSPQAFYWVSTLINFVVESGHPNEGAPAEIVSQIRRKRIQGISEFLGVAVLDDKKKCPGLQAADGLATGAWRLEQSSAMQERLVDIPQDVPLRNVRPHQEMKAPIFRCHIDAKELATFKDGYFAHIEYRKEWGRRRRANANSSRALSEELPS